jgi:hypothetical protein
MLSLASMLPAAAAAHAERAPGVGRLERGRTCARAGPGAEQKSPSEVLQNVKKARPQDGGPSSRGNSAPNWSGQVTETCPSRRCCRLALRRMLGVHLGGYTEREGGRRCARAAPGAEIKHSMSTVSPLICRAMGEPVGPPPGGFVPFWGRFRRGRQKRVRVTFHCWARNASVSLFRSVVPSSSNLS